MTTETATDPDSAHLNPDAEEFDPADVEEIEREISERASARAAALKAEVGYGLALEAVDSEAETQLVLGGGVVAPEPEPEPEDVGPKYSHTHLIQSMRYRPGYRPTRQGDIAADFWFKRMGASQFEWQAIPRNLQALQEGATENGVFTASFKVKYEQVPVEKLRKGKQPHEFVGDPGPYTLWYLDTVKGTGLPVAQYIFQTHLNDVNASLGKRACYLREPLEIRGALNVGARWERLGGDTVPDTWLAFGGALHHPDTIHTPAPFMVFKSEKAMECARRRLEWGKFVPAGPDFAYIGEL